MTSLGLLKNVFMHSTSARLEQLSKTFSPGVGYRRLHLAFAAATCLFVTWGLLTSDPLAVVRNTPLSRIRAVSDVIIHCSVYTVFSLSSLSLLRRRTDLWVRCVVFGLLVTHAVGTELLQTMIPRRTGDVLDATANLAGILLGTLIASRISQPMMQPSVSLFRRRDQD